VERLHQQLRESIHALVTSEDWRQALAVAARFHHYSFANTQLIWSQAEVRGLMPSRVAGYRTWQQLGRQVRRGERGIPILAPVTRKIEAPDGVEEEERRVVGFRVVHVFDISQTEGDPLPEVRAALVEGDLPAHWGGVAELITSEGFSLEVADVDRLGEANGITDWRDRMVVVRESLPGAQRFKTAVHELAHIRLHEPTSGSRPNCRGVVEVEAESVAYMVCAALGVDSTGYSLPYVAAWSGGDLDKIATTADRVMRCARRILDKVETEQDLARDRHASEITAQDRHPSRTDKRFLDPVETAPGEDRYPELEEALRSAVAFYRARLDEPEGAQARTFLDERRFTSDTVSRWQLGYAPASWDALVKTLRSQGIPDEVLLEAGLAGRARTGRLYDRMRARIVFPIFDEQGGPRGFAGRLIAGEGPKYLNGPETPSTRSQLCSTDFTSPGRRFPKPARSSSSRATPTPSPPTKPGSPTPSPPGVPPSPRSTSRRCDPPPPPSSSPSTETKQAGKQPSVSPSCPNRQSRASTSRSLTYPTAQIPPTYSPTAVDTS
jgi:antirestriction protein ArdC